MDRPVRCAYSLCIHSTRSGLFCAQADDLPLGDDDQHALETTELQDPEVLARQILEALPQVVAMLPPTEVRAALQRVEGLV